MNETNVLQGKQYPLSVMLNTSIRGKMPKGASDEQWTEYYRHFTPANVTAHELAVHIWRGFSFCPVYHSRRKQDNFEKAGHIAFDLDTTGLDKIAAVEWVDYFASFAYSTPSSTPEKPKSRVVFILELPITDKEEYRTLYHALAWRFAQEGIPTDPQCKDVLRLYYGSEKCSLWGNWSILPRGAIDSMIEDWRQAVPVAPKPARPQWSGLAETIDEQRIRDALMVIPPWGEYNDWMRVLMAVHSVFPDGRGIALCEGWSPGSPGEIERKFQSFTHRGDGVTIATLFKMAHSYGYTPPQREQRQQTKKTSGFSLAGRL